MSLLHGESFHVFAAHFAPICTHSSRSYLFCASPIFSSLAHASKIFAHSGDSSRSSMQRVIIFPTTAFSASMVFQNRLNHQLRRRAGSFPACFKFSEGIFKFQCHAGQGPEILKSASNPSYDANMYTTQRHWLQNVCGAGRCHTFLGITLDAGSRSKE